MMREKQPKPLAELYGIYKVDASHNAMIRASDPFRGRLHHDDWVICLGHGEYMVLKVNGSRITGLSNYRFQSKPLGVSIRWKPTHQEVGLLMAGQTITAPMDLIGMTPIATRAVHLSDTQRVVGSDL